MPTEPDLETYALDDPTGVLTPALLIYPAVVDANILAMIDLLGGDAARWRPHVKTSKLQWTMQRLVDHGVPRFKCATSLELATACAAGAEDVLVAYPVGGAQQRRVAEIAERYPDAAVSALVEDEEQVGSWRGSRVGLFIDINPGMDRTGLDDAGTERLRALAVAIAEAGLTFRGLHYYDGHRTEDDPDERRRRAERGYDELCGWIAELEAAGIEVDEVVTAGTPAMPASIGYPGFRDASFAHRISPGTVVYGDLTSRGQLPEAMGLRPAAVVLSTVVSLPTERTFTCDAGHKTVSADAGVPTCGVIGHPEWEAGTPSEEHLPFAVRGAGPLPRRGDPLYLVPRHVCPTVNNFDHALLVEHGKITAVEEVTARGREHPIEAAGPRNHR